MVRVLVAGVAVADFIFHVDEMPRRPEKYRARSAFVAGGGCAANAAVAIARHGGEAFLAARLGDDPVGGIILEELEREGVNTALVNRIEGGKSSFSSVYVDRAGERQIMNFPGSGLAGDTAWLDEIPPVDLVLADNRWPPLAKRAVEIARAQSVPCVIDAEAPMEPRSIEGASHVAFSAQGLDAFSEKGDTVAALEEARSHFGAWVCLTQGEGGVCYLLSGKLKRIAAFRIEAVDTLAAGDVWHGVFALRLAEGADEEDAMRFANAAAALKCTRFGGRAGTPDRASTERFLKERLECN